MTALLAAALIGAAVLVALGAGLALGERNQVGNVIASLDGGVSPLRLPRNRPAPVSAQLTGSLSTADGSTLPRIVSIEFGLAGRRENLDTRGLPVCPASRLLDTRDREALAVCGPSLVGHGSVDAQVLVPGQAPLAIHTHLLVF